MPTVLIGIVLLGERMTARGLAGTLLVVLAIVLTSWRIDKHLPSFQWISCTRRNCPDYGRGPPSRRYALIQSHEPLFFTAIVGPISLVALAIYYATPLCNEKLVRDRRAFWPFLISGFFETLAVLLMLLAFSSGPVVVVSPLASTTLIWTLIISPLFLQILKDQSRQCDRHSVGGCSAVAIGALKAPSALPAVCSAPIDRPQQLRGCQSKIETATANRH